MSALSIGSGHCIVVLRLSAYLAVEDGGQACVKACALPFVPAREGVAVVLGPLFGKILQEPDGGAAFRTVRPALLVSHLRVRWHVRETRAEILYPHIAVVQLAQRILQARNLF